MQDAKVRTKLQCNACSRTEVRSRIGCKRLGVVGKIVVYLIKVFESWRGGQRKEWCRVLRFNRRVYLVFRERRNRTKYCLIEVLLNNEAPIVRDGDL